MEISAKISAIIKGVESTMNNNGFAVIVPQGIEKGALPVTEKNGCTTILYGGKKGTAKIELFEEKISLFCSAAESGSAVDEDFKKVTTTLFDLETVDERDIRYAVNEINDCINDTYGKKEKAKKLPQPVSKSAAKSGSVYYDLVTLGSRFVQIYPELKDAYKENFQTYSEFLGEDFFVNHANKYIMDTIRSNDTQTMKKLFKILSDIYENGSNDVQDLVVVTILGEIDNDQTLLDRCHEYITDNDFYDTLVAVNKYLASSAGKKAKELMKNPPAYKPPKKKSGGLMSQMMSGGGMPPQM